MAEVGVPNNACGRAVGSYDTIPHRHHRSSSGDARRRDRDGIFFRSAIPAYLYSLARARFSSCEMGGAGRHVPAGFRACGGQVALVANAKPLDRSVDRMDTGFDSPQAPRGGVAQAVVPLTQSFASRGVRVHELFLQKLS